MIKVNVWLNSKNLYKLCKRSSHYEPEEKFTADEHRVASLHGTFDYIACAMSIS